MKSKERPNGDIEKACVALRAVSDVSARDVAEILDRELGLRNLYASSDATSFPGHPGGAGGPSMAWTDWLDRLPATRGDVRRLETRMNGQQQQIDGITAKLKTAETTMENVGTELGTISTGISNLKTNQAALQKQIDDLTAQNPALDLTALQSAADLISTDTATVQTAADSAAALLAPPAPQPIP